MRNLELLPKSYPSQSKGSVLLISLVLLTALTVLGMTSMRGSITNEKIARNVQDLHLATEAAESAIRIGHRELTNPKNRAFDVGYVSSNITSPLFPPTIPDINNWEAGSGYYEVTAAQLDTTDPNFSTRKSQSLPKYRIERFFVPNTELDIGHSIPAEEKEIRATSYYRVIGRGVGLSNNENPVLLESIVIEGS